MHLDVFREARAELELDLIPADTVRLEPTNVLARNIISERFVVVHWQPEPGTSLGVLSRIISKDRLGKGK